MPDIELTNGQPVPEDRSHTEIDPKTGLQKGYICMTAAERAKGFVKPVRRSYKHVGPPPAPTNLRELTPEEKERHTQWGYVKFEPQSVPGSSIVGRYWTQAELDRAGSNCGCVTTMATSLAETYARDPHFYSGTFCCGCQKHYPLNEFVWEPDGEPMDPSLQEEWAKQAPERARAARKERRDRLNHQISLKYKDIAELTDQIARLDAEGT